MKKLTKEERVQVEEQWYRERQNPELLKKMRIIGWGLAAFSTVVSVVNMLEIGPYGLWSVSALICFGISVILCAVFPAYFSLGHAQWEKGRKYTFPIVNLLFSYYLPIAILAIRTLNEFTYVNWLETAVGVVAVAMVIGVAMGGALPEFRCHRGNWIAAVILLTMFGLGLMGPLNHLLDWHEPQTVQVKVAEYHPGAGKSSPTYELVQADGTSFQLSAYDGFRPREYNIGQMISVEYREGAFGIAYWCYPEES